MSLLLKRKGPAAPLPRLEGKEVLVGPNPDAAKVKGVMFGGRKQFLNDVAGEEGFAAIIAKLTPNVTDVVAIAEAAAEAGADAVSLANTFRGLAVNWRARRPVLANDVGGLSGPARKLAVGQRGPGCLDPDPVSVDDRRTGEEIGRREGRRGREKRIAHDIYVHHMPTSVQRGSRAHVRNLLDIGKRSLLLSSADESRRFTTCPALAVPVRPRRALAR